MTTQPEALRLAEQLEAIGLRGPVAAELRRLSAVEAQRDALLEALKAFANEIVPNNPNDPIWVNARAAIKAVEGEKT